MKFGPVPIGEAVGARLAHSVAAGGLRLRKGALVTPEVAEALARAGLGEVIVSRLEEGDVAEDEAAARLAEALAGEGLRIEAPFTGRCNLFATRAGLLVVDCAKIDAANAVDDAITVATLDAFAPLAEGEMAATVKIIPFAAPAAALARAVDAARGALSAPAFRPLRVGVVATLTDGFKPSVAAKTSRVLAERLAPAGATIVGEERTAHDGEAVARAIRDLATRADLLVLFGASAIADRRDVLPRGLEIAGGAVEHLGMPVDPGNLLMLGRLGDMPVIGAPGCARSPRENGFDWVLRRILAGVPVGADDIRRMGVGGLLKEIASRPQPREPSDG